MRMWFLSCLENLVSTLMLSLGLLDKEIDSLPKVSGGEQYLSSNSNKALHKAQELASAAKDEFVSIEQLLLAILSLDDSASRLLKSSGVNEKDLKSAISQLRKGSSVNSPTAEETYNALKQVRHQPKQYGSGGKIRSSYRPRQ